MYVQHFRDGKVHAQAANGRGLVGGRFKLDYPSVGATETLMMAACMADGVTVLSNVAKVRNHTKVSVSCCKTETRVFLFVLSIALNFIIEVTSDPEIFTTGTRSD